MAVITAEEVEILKRQMVNNKIILPAPAFDALTELLEESKDQQPNPALKALMARPTRWVPKKENSDGSGN